MLKRMLVVTAMIAVLGFAVSVAQADMFVLKPIDDPGLGYTYSEVADVQIEWASATGRHYHYGGAATFGIGTSWASWPGGGWRLSLVQFDLDTIEAPPGATLATVNSATLRLFQTAGGAGNMTLARMLEDWEEGTSGGTWGQIFDGANAYARNMGHSTLPGDLVQTQHNGADVWYFDATDLAVNPVDDDAYYHYIARRDSTGVGVFRNFDLHGRRLSQADDLDDLITWDGDITRVYYYDEVAERVYLATGSYQIHWFQTGDLWADLRDETATRGPREGSWDDDDLYQTVLSGSGDWTEVDITGMVEKWLIDGEANFGMALYNNPHNDSSFSFASSEENRFWNPDSGEWSNEWQTGFWYVQPELILDLSFAMPIPEPAGLSLLGLALLGLKRKRRR